MRVQSYAPVGCDYYADEAGCVGIWQSRTLRARQKGPKHVRGGAEITQLGRLGRFGSVAAEF